MRGCRGHGHGGLIASMSSGSDRLDRDCRKGSGRRGGLACRGGAVVAVDFVDDVDAPLGFDPTILVGEAGIGTEGSDDAVCRGRDAADVCQKVIEDGAEIFGAPSVQVLG